VLRIYPVDGISRKSIVSGDALMTDLPSSNSASLIGAKVASKEIDVGLRQFPLSG
jgi:hypothetical protein